MSVNAGPENTAALMAFLYATGKFGMNLYIAENVRTDTAAKIIQPRKDLMPAEKAMLLGTRMSRRFEFTKYIKEQKRKLAADEPNDFRKEFDEKWLEWYNKKNPDNQVSDPSSDTNGVWFRDRIYVTAFVDEFYYDKHPISGESSQTLWKDFVNVPNRIMHILCDSRSSFDEESTSTGSVVTIRQRSIQTPYSTTGDCPTAWGCCSSSWAW